MSNFFDSEIERTYKCLSCGYTFDIIQKLKDKWKKKCPSCKKRELVIYGSKSSISNIVDLNKPKTLGSLAEKNRDQKEKRGESVEGFKKKPFWRKDHKINYDILKNPKKYIEKGSV